MKVIQNKFIPFPGYSYINLFGLLFTRNKNKISEKDYNHEKIHLKQMQEMLWVPYYLWYCIEYLLIRLFHKKQGDAYHDVSFEEEAHNNELDFEYTKNRKHYAWCKYVKPKSYGKK